MSHAYSDDADVNRSLQHSKKDAALYSIMAGGGETYFSAFAVFLKAGASQIAVLASLPPLLAAAAQLFSAWLGRRSGLRKPIILVGVFMQAFCWLPLVALPLLFPDYALELLTLCVVCYFATGNMVVPQWSSLMGDLVPENSRGRYFASRTRLASFTSFVALIASGLVLHYLTKQGNEALGFIIIFTIAAIARVGSAYHLRKMTDPPRSTLVSEVTSPMAAWRRIHHSPFVRFSLFFALMQFAVAIASPFFTLYMLRDLNFTYLQFMTNTAVVVLAQIATFNVWGHISDHFGNRVILRTTGVLITTVPMLWLFSSYYPYLLLIQAISGLAWAGFSLSAGNFLYDLVPSPKRAILIAYHNVFANVAVFLGAMLGGYLGMTLPKEVTLFGHHYTWHSSLLGIFLLSSIARMLVALIFIPLLREVREVPALSTTGIIFRIARFNALAGLVFDILMPKKRRSGINE